MGNTDEQQDEMLVLQSIYDSTVLTVEESEGFHCGTFLAQPTLPTPFTVIVPKLSNDGTYGNGKQEISLEHLPPICLKFELPKSYPSDSPPKFCLSCTWLTMQQLGILCKALDRLWHQDPYSVVLYRWMDFLQNEALCELRIEQRHSLGPLLLYLSKKKHYSARHASQPRLRLKQCLKYPGDAHYDDRAFKEQLDPSLLLCSLTDYNSKKKQDVFQQQWLHCQVCMNEKLGSQFLVFFGCNHYFCKECMSSFFRIQIESGSASFLRCPQEGCTSQASPPQVKELVGEALCNKYEAMLLSTYLDTLADLTYCPRLHCQCPVVLDPDLTLAECPSCHFVFCIYCKMVYHGVEPCRLKPDERREIRDRYVAATGAEKLEMERRYGKRTLQLLVVESLSQDWMNENSKKCPHCNVSIEKQDGCNKMTCWRCGTHFCWLCVTTLKSISNPYQHFNDPASPCFNKLFHGVEGLEEIDDVHDIGEFL
ncbi:E3 ubiquitin-protein ligase RNF14-like [Ornithodoros turicata]|uniref:E3 ubiquitin-protein ligase RNF14-like n=1 Tax=Ornithodoros turicata TaxID=34597 RepID=UPI003139F67A